MATVTLLAGSRNLPDQLTIDDTSTHRGGEGTIYFSSDKQYVVKTYHSPPADKQEMLQKIVELGKNLGDDDRLLAWPLGIVHRFNDQATMGVVTRFVPHAPLYKFTLSPRDAFTQFRQGRSWLDYVKLARGAAAALRVVHGKGMAHGDIHLRNFLAQPATGEVVLIDLDGLIVKGELKAQVLGVPGFIAPEVMTGKSKPEELTDRHSLAVLVLWILLLRNVMQTQVCYDDEDELHDDILGYGPYACFSENPNDRRNWLARIGTPLFHNGLLSYRILTPTLQILTERALIQSLHEPTKRPQVLEWERALADSYDVLFKCRNTECNQSFYYPYWLQPPPRRTCPFCGTAVRPPFPVVLELREARGKGVFSPVRFVVLDHATRLFADVREPGYRPPFTRRGTAIIAQTAWDARIGSYRLQNTSDTAWTIISGGSGLVERGASIPLRSGLIFSFGEGKRLARIIE